MVWEYKRRAAVLAIAHRAHFVAAWVCWLLM